MLSAHSSIEGVKKHIVKEVECSYPKSHNSSYSQEVVGIGECCCAAQLYGSNWPWEHYLFTT